MWMLLATVIAGALSGITLMKSELALYWGPGFFFGLGTGIVFMKFGYLNRWTRMVWVVASMLIWYLVVYMFIGLREGPLLNSFIACGIIGSMMLAAAAKSFVPNISVLIIPLTFAAGVLGSLVIGAIFPGEHPTILDEELWFQHVSSFVAWQVPVGMALLVGLAIKKRGSKGALAAAASGTSGTRASRARPRGSS
jgi:hypothetical protein